MTNDVDVTMITCPFGSVDVIVVGDGLSVGVTEGGVVVGFVDPPLPVAIKSAIVQKLVASHVTPPGQTQGTRSTIEH